MCVLIIQAENRYYSCAKCVWENLKVAKKFKELKVGYWKHKPSRLCLLLEMNVGPIKINGGSFDFKTISLFRLRKPPNNNKPHHFQHVDFLKLWWECNFLLPWNLASEGTEDNLAKIISKSCNIEKCVFTVSWNFVNWCWSYQLVLSLLT